MKFFTKDEIDSKFIFMLTYMLALFTADLPPELIVIILSELQYFEEYSSTFQKLRILINGYRYKFSTAINIIARKLPIKPLKDFLIRFSQALSHGDNMNSYLEREIESSLSEYNASNNRKIESMANFLSIYATLSSSLIFLMVNLTIVSILFNVGTALLNLMTLALMLILGMLTLVVYLLYKPESYVIYARKEMYVALLAIQSSIILIALERNYVSVVASGLILLAMGLYFRMKERKLETLERHYIGFVAYFSRTYSVVQNLKEALSSVLRGDVGSMRPLIQQAYNRLQYGVRKSLIFNLMGEESGSVLVLMMNRILSATIEYGGNVRYVGEQLSKIGNSLLNIRARREQNGRAFEASVYALQAASSALGGTLLALLQIFEKIFSFAVVSNIFTLGQVSIPVLELLMLLILVTLSFANGISISIAYGRTFFAGLYFVGVLMIITALGFHFTYVITSALFNGLFQGLPPITGLQQI